MNFSVIFFVEKPDSLVRELSTELRQTDSSMLKTINATLIL